MGGAGLASWFTPGFTWYSKCLNFGQSGFQTPQNFFRHLCHKSLNLCIGCGWFCEWNPDMGRPDFGHPDFRHLLIIDCFDCRLPCSSLPSPCLCGCPALPSTTMPPGSSWPLESPLCSVLDSPSSHSKLDGTLPVNTFKIHTIVIYNDPDIRFSA